MGRGVCGLWRRGGDFRVSGRDGVDFKARIVEIVFDGADFGFTWGWLAYLMW